MPKLLIAALLLFFALPLHAQISISPTVIFIHDNSNVATLYIANRSDETQEVAISARFGYPDSDEDGNLVMNYADEEAEAAYGLTERLRVFPRSVRLEPGSQQMVRIQVLPESGRPDGLYWTRLSIISNTVTPDLDQERTEGIGTRISYRFDQNIGVYYRRGEVGTGLNVLSVGTERDGDELTLKPVLQRTGNSPYMGSMSAVLYNSAGQPVRESQQTFTAFFTQTRPIQIDVSGLPPGNYSVEIRFETRRRDIRPEDIVGAPAITERINVQL